MFYFFLTRFNEASRAGMYIQNKIAGITTAKKIKAIPTKEPTPTVTMIPTIVQPSPTVAASQIIKIPIGNIKIEEQEVTVNIAVDNFQPSPISVEETRDRASLQKIIQRADFSIQLNFPEKVAFGSADNKFIFQNQEYEIKIFSQVGTKESYEREKFFAEKTGSDVKMLMFQIIDNKYIIIKREMGLWSQGVQVAVGAGVNDEEIKKNIIRFFVE